MAQIDTYSYKGISLDFFKYLAWQAFNDVKSQTIPIRGKVFGIPLSLNVPVASLTPLMVLLFGPEPSNSPSTGGDPSSNSPQTTPSQPSTPPTNVQASGVQSSTGTN